MRSGKGEITIPVGQVQVGTVVIVKPGERVPVDGVVVAGASSVNQAPITGESMPVEKFKGSELFSGTLNLTGRVEARATKVGADTTLARIVHLVEEAQGIKAPIQNLADRFTVWFLPVVLVLAIIVFFVTGNVKTAVSLLLVACPCAFAIATPTAVTAGISNMARRAVLVKGGIFFELAGKIDALVVDKTGTFTLGRPEVLDVVAFDGVPSKEILEMAAVAEKHSEHPLAQGGGELRQRARAGGAGPGGVQGGDWAGSGGAVEGAGHRGRERGFPPGQRSDSVRSGAKERVDPN